MSSESAAQFATNTRVHMGLAVKDVSKSIDFYKSLLGLSPTKLRSAYARFEVADPPVNLSLIQASGMTGPNNPASHFGIQVKDRDSLRQYEQRCTHAGIEVRAESEVTCCHAVQEKRWVVDPDGNAWEVYLLLEDEGDLSGQQRDACCGELASSTKASAAQVSCCDR